MLGWIFCFGSSNTNSSYCCLETNKHDSTTNMEEEFNSRKRQAHTDSVSYQPLAISLADDMMAIINTNAKEPNELLDKTLKHMETKALERLCFHMVYVPSFRPMDWYTWHPRGSDLMRDDLEKKGKNSNWRWKVRPYLR